MGRQIRLRHYRASFVSVERVHAIVIIGETISWSKTMGNKRGQLPLSFAWNLCTHTGQSMGEAMERRTDTPKGASVLDVPWLKTTAKLSPACHGSLGRDVTILNSGPSGTGQKGRYRCTEHRLLDFATPLQDAIFGRPQGDYFPRAFPKAWVQFC